MNSSKSFSEAEIDFKLEVTGFETSEIDLFIENLAPDFDGQADPGDILPKASSMQVSRNGDLWRLGKHRVLCGDSLSPASYERLMGGQKAQMVFIDPPYNDPIDGCVSALGKVQHPECAMASGERGETEYASFLAKLLGQLAANSIEGALQFICLDWRHTSEVILAARSVYTEFMNLCVWVKENGEQGHCTEASTNLFLSSSVARDPSQQYSTRTIWPRPLECLALPPCEFVVSKQRRREDCPKVTQRLDPLSS